MNKQRKIYAAFLGLAAVGFIADRVYFQPAGASASTVSVAEEHAAPASSTQAKPEPLAPTLANRIEASTRDFQDEGRDAFEARWATKAASPAADIRPLADDFRQKHSVTMLGVIKAVQFAVVDGKMIRIGEQVDGWTLVAVRESFAAFERENEYVQLSHAAPTKSK